MTDDQLIVDCERRCARRADYPAWKVNRMLKLAGYPSAYPLNVNHGIRSMHADMQDLVRLAKNRSAAT